MRRLFAAALVLAIALPCAARTAGAAASAEEIAAIQRMASRLAVAMAALPGGERIPSDQYLLDGPLARLRDHPPYSEVLRTPGAQRERASGRDSLEADREAMRDFWYDEADPPHALRTRLKARLSGARFDSLDAAMEAVQDYDLARAMGIYQRRLDRFEAKYGPGSPKLNLLEAGINLFLQDHWPLKPDADGPSSNEIILGYSSSYFAIVDQKMHALSVIEAGLRRYRLDWVESDAGIVGGFLRPRYWCLGLGIAAENAGALRWPLDLGSDRSYGPFFNWGDLKVAYFFGAQHRVAVSRQLHLVPGMF